MAVAATSDGDGRRGHSAEALTKLVMVAPVTVVFTAFKVIPLGLAVYLSLTSWNGFSAAEFIGLDNYRRVFTHADMSTAAMVTVVISLVCTLVISGLGLLLAMLINGPGQANAIYRAAIFYPYLVSLIVVGFVWGTLLAPTGTLNGLGAQLGLGPWPFLVDPHWAVGSVIATIVWHHLGFTMVIYLAGLQTIPGELIDAALVDGASWWQRLRHVVVPMLAPVVTVNLVLLTVGLLRVYDIVVALTGGGPAGSTETVVYEILATSYAEGRLGYGSAQAILLLAVSLVLTVLIITYRRRREVRL